MSATKYTVRWLVINNHGDRLFSEDLEITADCQAAAMTQAMSQLQIRAPKAMPPELQIVLFTVPEEPPDEHVSMFVCLAANPAEWFAQDAESGNNRPLTAEELAIFNEAGPGIYAGENPAETKEKK